MTKEKPLDLTKPVQTRGGQPVRILCTDLTGSVSPIVGARMFWDGSEYVCQWTLDGRLVGLGSGPTILDLINKPEVMYVNVYQSGGPKYGHPDRKSADYAVAIASGSITSNRIACVRVEEGQFDD